MISVQIDNPLGFWVTDTSEIHHILGAMSIYMEALYALGYSSDSVHVGGGVDEGETGYKAFSKHYSSFEDMKEHLCHDFDEEESKLDGIWFDTLNFEDILVMLKKADSNGGRMDYHRGILKLECKDGAVIEEQCRTAISPYLYQ